MAVVSRTDDAELRVLPHVCCRSPGTCGVAPATLPGGGGVVGGSSDSGTSAATGL